MPLKIRKQKAPPRKLGPGAATQAGYMILALIQLYRSSRPGLLTWVDREIRREIRRETNDLKIRWAVAKGFWDGEIWWNMMNVQWKSSLFMVKSKQPIDFKGFFRGFWIASLLQVVYCFLCSWQYWYFHLFYPPKGVAGDIIWWSMVSDMADIFCVSIASHWSSPARSLEKDGGDGRSYRRVLVVMM